VGTIEAGALVLEPGNNVEARVKVASSQDAVKGSGSAPKPKLSLWPLRLKKIKDFALGRA
jgi:hypothetical protein